MRKTTSFFSSENQELEIKRNTPFANGITKGGVSGELVSAKILILRKLPLTGKTSCMAVDWRIRKKPCVTNS
jgi:hypothetical protein